MGYNRFLMGGALSDDEKEMMNVYEYVISNYIDKFKKIKTEDDFKELVLLETAVTSDEFKVESRIYGDMTNDKIDKYEKINRLGKYLDYERYNLNKQTEGILEYIEKYKELHDKIDEEELDIEEEPIIEINPIVNPEQFVIGSEISIALEKGENELTDMKKILSDKYDNFMYIKELRDIINDVFSMFIKNLVIPVMEDAENLYKIGKIKTYGTIGVGRTEVVTKDIDVDKDYIEQLKTGIILGIQSKLIGMRNKYGGYTNMIHNLENRVRNLVGKENRKEFVSELKNVKDVNILNNMISSLHIIKEIIRIRTNDKFTAHLLSNIIIPLKDTELDIDDILKVKAKEREEFDKKRKEFDERQEELENWEGAEFIKD